MRIIIIVIAILCASCLSDKDKNIVIVNNIDEKIYIGMPKKDLIEKIGTPKDSVISDRVEKGNYIYIYDTNDFTGYTLKVWFNSNNEISRYRVD